MDISAALGNNMTLVREAAYDAPDCGGCSAGGGSLTQQILHVDASTTRVTTYHYDWRQRREYEVAEADAQGHVTYSHTEYDNLDRPLRVERFVDADDDGDYPSGAIDAGDTRLARSETAYDARGRVYRTTTYAILPNSGGVLGASLSAQTWYDASGQVIKQQEAGTQAFTKTVYDGLGRAVTSYLGFDADETGYTQAAGVADDTIVEQTQRQYDAAGNVVLAILRQRLHSESDTATGPLQTLTTAPRARVSTTAQWYDGAGRPVAAADYGAAANVVRPSSPPPRSATVLLGTTDYNPAGEAAATVDPAGIVTQTVFDAAGRKIRVTVNADSAGKASDQNVVTEFGYNADGLLVRLTARNPDTGDQTTRYCYGTTLSESGIARADLLRAEIYPDSDDTGEPLGAGLDTTFDRVEYTYNRQGERVTLTDQNGTVHTYHYDGLGRMDQDTISVVGAGIDDRVRRIERRYDVSGRVEWLRSYDASDTVVNDVMFYYNSWGQVYYDCQAHAGGASAGSPRIVYYYGDGSAGHIRLTMMANIVGGMTLRRLLFYGYNAGADDAFNRVSFLADEGSTNTPGQHLAEYAYLGRGTIVQTSYPQPGLTSGATHGTGDDPYAGLDVLGRVTDLRWRRTSDGSDVERVQHAYDAAGNRLNRRTPVATAANQAFDELYAYDRLNRLIAAQRGQLEQSGQTVSALALQQQWTLDATGNWERFQQTVPADPDQALDQLRQHNPANELTALSDLSPVAHDRAGNMVSVPCNLSPVPCNLTCVYDAWNRLVKVSDPDTQETLVEYQYDSQHRRIVRRAYSEGTLSEARHYYYYDQQWRVVDEHLEATAYPLAQYVWGQRYVDDLILRDRNADGNTATGQWGRTNSGLEERLYALQDANGNVTAIVSDAGVVQERFSYTPYGIPTFHAADWSASSAESAYAWDILYTGRPRDPLTGLQENRHRWYAANLGRWISRDPIAYRSGLNLYEYVGDRPLTRFDPLGLIPLDALPCDAQAWTIANAACQAQTPPTNFEGPPRVRCGMKYSVNLFRELFLKTVYYECIWKPKCKCSKAELVALNAAVSAACDGPNRGAHCYPGMSREKALENAARFSACEATRNAINQKCFSGGDAGHKEAASNARRAAANCMEIAEHALPDNVM